MRVKFNQPYTLASLKREAINRAKREQYRRERNAQKAYERWAVYKVIG